MSKATPQQLKEAYQKLPEQVRVAYSSEETTEKIYTIGKKYDLHVDQMGELVDEVGLVMVGIVSFEVFTKEIITRLKINDELAQKITTDINNEIFLPIRVYLREATNKTESSPSTNSQPEPIPTTNVFEEKMGKMFNLNDNPTPEVLEEPEVDPYREPV